MLITDLTDILNQGAMQTPARSASPSIDKQGFLELLVKQLSTQDPLSPMDNNQFIQQLTSFSSLEQQINLNQNFGQFLNLQQLTQASALLGKEVISLVQGDNGLQTLTGTVDQVEMMNGTAYLKLSTGDEVPLASVVSVQTGGAS